MKSPVIIPIQHYQCPFVGKDVADNSTTENVNIKDCSPPAYATLPMPDNLNREEVRLRTFNDWPHRHITPEKLAKTGFYFIGPNNDLVKCYFCKVEIGCWEPNDDELSEHMRWSQNCPLLRRRDTNNVPTDAVELDRLLPPPTYDVCGPYGVVDVRHGSYAESSAPETQVIETTVTPYKPDYPEYAIESARLRSFEDWPKVMKQKPKDLSDAGFFYTQKGDRVLCFSCGGGLRDWEENDVPWEEHARFHYTCEYLKLIKGQVYIDSILAKDKLQESDIGTPDDEENSKSDETHAKLTKTTNSIESTSSSSGSDYESGYEDGPSEKKLCDSRCKICYQCEFNTAFLPCGHVVACAKCASSVTKCPVCRKPFDSIMRVYFS